MLTAYLMPRIQNTAFSHKDGIQTKGPTTNVNILMFVGPPFCGVWRDIPLEENKNYRLN